MPTITATTTIDRPAEAVWAIVADYGRDPEWRAGVETMAPDPAGEVRLGTTTAEVMHLAGRTYHNDGEVTDVEPGARFAWRTTSGADADGSRAVRPLDEGRCEVTLVLNVRAHGAQRLLQPLLVSMLRRGQRADLARLADLVERGVAASAA
jgi:uncharacterized protein YndB with AHSA1/START domain